MTIEARFLCSIEDNTVILCERHAKIFEAMGITANVPHTIVELEEEDAPKYCHSCDLQVAKEHVKRRDQVNESKIILPGQYI
jgi:hypothetical protein